MNVPDRIVRAIIVELKASLRRADAVHSVAVLLASTNDEFVRESAAARVDTANLIGQLERLFDRDPHAARTPLPPPMPAAPPGMRMPERLAPPPRKKR